MANNRLQDKIVAKSMIKINLSYLILFVNILISIQVTNAHFDCTIERCKNGGLCIQSRNSMNSTNRCECLPGFMGSYCELSSQSCERSSCNNRGRCIQNLKTTQISCICDSGYHGEMCEMSNLCLNSKCQNGGTCYPVAAVSYYCTCPPGLTGPRCERYTTPKSCKFNVCKNGGNCTISPGGLIQCACREGFIGNACEINKAVCEGRSCNNRGVCLSQFDGDYKCECEPSFGGKDCEIENICLENNCLNGGVCQTISQNLTKCICTPSFFGKRCEYRICDNDPELEPPNHTALVPFVPIVPQYKAKKVDTNKKKELITDMIADLNLPKLTSKIGKIIDRLRADHKLSFSELIKS